MYFRLIAAIFDLRLMPTSYSVHNSPIVFLNHGNAGLVNEISSLSILTKTYFLYLLPAYGRYLNFRFEHSHQLYIVEIQFGCLTVQWKPDTKLPPVSKIMGGGFGSRPRQHNVTINDLAAEF